MKIEVVYYSNGIIVEDEEGNKLYVNYNMFTKDYRQERNCIAFAIGEILMDRSYNSKELKYTEKFLKGEIYK